MTAGFPSDSTESLTIDNSAALSEPEPEPQERLVVNRHRRPAFSCHIPGCRHKGTFTRIWEFNRHILAKHNYSAKRFKCGAHGCLQGRSPSAFIRSDKLTAHIKSMHTRDTIFTQCPFKDCKFVPSTLEYLGVHISRKHGKHEQSCGVLNATTCKTLKCPLWRCRMSVSADKAPSHMRDHDVEDLQAAASTLLSDGFVVVCPPIVEHSAPTKSSFDINVVCPVCKEVNADVKHFVGLLWTSHIFSVGSGGAEHFVRWKDAWVQSIPSEHSYLLTIGRLSPWLTTHDFHGYGKSRTVQCPCCPFFVADFGGEWRNRKQQDYKDKNTQIANHHPSLLRPQAEVIAELYPYRMQILKLYPDFVTHPVFSDFDLPN